MVPHTYYLMVFIKHQLLLLFISNTDTTIICLLIYIDDLLITSNNFTTLQHFIQELSTSFAIKDMGPLNHFLGINVNTSANGFYLSQTSYIY